MQQKHAHYAPHGHARKWTNESKLGEFILTYRFWKDVFQGSIWTGSGWAFDGETEEVCFGQKDPETERVQNSASCSTCSPCTFFCPHHTNSPSAPLVANQISHLLQSCLSLLQCHPHSLLLYIFRIFCSCTLPLGLFAHAPTLLLKIPTFKCKSKCNRSFSYVVWIYLPLCIRYWTSADSFNFKTALKTYLFKTPPKLNLS